MACQLLGYDNYLPEYGLNKLKESSGPKLMFEKQGSLADTPVSGGAQISKLTCYKREKIKSSVHAKVGLPKAKTTIFSNIYFLRGDLTYPIAFQDQLSLEENFKRVCKLLNRKDAADIKEADYSIIYKNGPAVIVDESPKLESVIFAPAFIDRVECLNNKEN